MKRRPRLVILGSSLTALAVARDAHRHRMVPVVVDRSRGIAFSSRWVQPVLVPDLHGDATLARVLEHAGTGSALVATGDDWLRFIVAARTALAAAFDCILHPSNAMLEVFLNKHLFSAWCHEQALPAPCAWLAGAQPRPPGLAFPLLVRPNETQHARPQLGLPKAVEVHTEAELLHWQHRFAACGVGALVSQSLLAQRLTQYSVPFARTPDRLLSFVARKLRPGPRQCAEGTYVEVTTHDAVERLARRAVEHAQYFGIGEVEILHSHDTGRSLLIEVNARPWLQYALAPASGHDFLGLLLGAGGAPAAAPRTLCKGWINLRGDRYAAFSRAIGSVRHRSLGLAVYLRSLARRNVYAVLDWRDPMPFVRTVLRRG